MAFLREGTVTMRANTALTAEEVDEGWILTCQSLPTGRTDCGGVRRPLADYRGPGSTSRSR